MTNRVPARRARSAIPKSVWALGFVSLFMDVSSEMIHALLPAFLVTVVGAGALTVGLIEGVAEATASIVKVFSGALSDALGKRKLLAVAGYGLSALTKPLFPLATSALPVFGARFADRIGKGIRGAPRDALIADLTPPDVRGRAYGLRQSLDTVGAFCGPLLAIALMAASGDDFRFVFWVAVIPALIAVSVLVFAVKEPRHLQPAPLRSPIRLDELRRLGPAFWRLVIVASLLTLARFSEAFLLLRVQDLGLAVAWLPLALVVMNLVYSVAAYPIGVLADRSNPRVLLGIGFCTLIVADLVLAFAQDWSFAMLGVALWGLHMGMTQGLFATLVAQVAPADRRGTAFGLFHLGTGLALLAASVIAGALWQWLGGPATFLAGALFTLTGLIAAAALLRRGGTAAASRSP